MEKTDGQNTGQAAHEMSDEALEEALGNPHEPTEDTTSEDVEDTSADTSEQVEDGEVQADAESPAQTEAPEGTPVVIDPAEYAKLQKQVADKETFIQQQASEIGELRKPSVDSRQPLASIDSLGLTPEIRQELDDLSVKDPVAFYEAMQTITSAIEKDNNQLAQTQYAQAVEANKQSVNAKVEGFEDLLKDEVVDQVLADKGWKPADIQYIKTNPYAVPENYLLNLASEVLAQRKIKELNAKVAELSGKTKETLQKIDKAAKSRPLKAESGGGTNKQGKVANVKAHKMSDADLDAALAERT